MLSGQVYTPRDEPIPYAETHFIRTEPTDHRTQTKPTDRPNIRIIPASTIPITTTNNCRPPTMASRIPEFTVPIGDTTLQIPILSLDAALFFITTEFAAIAAMPLPGHGEEGLGFGQWAAHIRAQHFTAWCQTHLRLADPFDDANFEVRCLEFPRCWNSVVRRLRAVYEALREVVGVLEVLQSGQKDQRTLTEEQRSVVMCFRYDLVWNENMAVVEKMETREALEMWEKALERFPEPDSDAEEEEEEDDAEEKQRGKKKIKFGV